MYNIDASTGQACNISMNTSEFTKIKHMNFEHFLDTMFDTWFKDKSPFYFIDLNAGSGIYPNGDYCMCMRFIERYIKSGHDLSLLNGIMCEANSDSLQMLISEFIKRDLNNSFEFLCNNNIVAQLPGSQDRGLILYDPNGIGDFNIINKLLALYPNMDLFTHLQPGFAARRFWDKDYVPMFENIRNIQNSRVLVSHVYNKYIDCAIVKHISKKLRSSSCFFVPRGTTGLYIFRKLSYKWRSFGRRLTTERFIKKAKEHHGDKYSYEKTKYYEMHNPVIVTCPIHGDFSIWPSNHLIGSGCPQCGWTNGWLRRTSGLKKVTLSEFIRRANEIHNSFYQYDKVQHFQNTMHKVTITCPIHGDFQQTITTHLVGRGCPRCAIERRVQKWNLTTDIFISRAKKKFGDKLSYDKTVYKNAKTKVVITCPIHGDFEQWPMHHLNGTGCPKCTKYTEALTQEQFIKRAKSVHGDRYTYEHAIYRGVKYPVTITCRIHGKFTPNANNFLNGHNCPKCAHGCRTTEDFIQDARKIHGDIYSYDRTNYTSGHCNVIITCPIHGDFEQSVQNHLRGNGCRKCAMIRIGLKRAFTQEQFLKKAKEKHGDKYDYSNVEFTRTKDKVEIICPIHGAFQQEVSSHLKGAGCKKCAIAFTAEKKRKKKNSEN